MSPEQCNEEGYNEKSDIWSLGIIIYELANLSPPFVASNHLALALKIREGKYERIPENYSEELMRVI
jgi:NIMA (never in mitosis gene a)-related kinase